MSTNSTTTFSRFHTKEKIPLVLKARPANFELEKISLSYLFRSITHCVTRQKGRILREHPLKTYNECPNSISSSSTLFPQPAKILAKISSTVLCRFSLSEMISDYEKSPQFEAIFRPRD